jgi:hypothetical protein
MHEFFVWLETSEFSRWVRESTSLLAFPGILSAHTISMGFLAGINALVDLRILGVAKGVPFDELKKFFPIMWTAFWVSATSGVALLIGYPTKALTNPLFYAKLAFIAMAMVLLKRIRVRAFGGSPENARVLARWSLFFWASVIVAGRLLAYTYTKLTSID